MHAPLDWRPLARADGVQIEQARARNNSWYLIVPEGSSFELRYASQAGNYLVAQCASPDDAKRAADAHADRYDTREQMTIRAREGFARLSAGAGAPAERSETSPEPVVEARRRMPTGRAT